jgi:aspartate/methionine/tyrosine aminotransferase
MVRENVARFIAERDGHPADAEHIFLTDGASDGIKRILNCIIRDSRTGVRPSRAHTALTALGHDIGPAVPAP